jgi:hypothetical protein
MKKQARPLHDFLRWPLVKDAIMKTLGITALLALGLAGSALAFPTWMGVYGSYRRHTDESNPGTFTILMNQDYVGLHANVGIQVNGGSWTEYSMSYAGNNSGNSVWTYTPPAAYATGDIVAYYFHGYEDFSGSTIYDSNGGANYLFQIPQSITGSLLSIAQSNGNCVVSWQGGGVLQSTLTLTGGWSDVAGAVSPFSDALTNSARFYRVRYPATFAVVDTGQAICYGNTSQIASPAPGQPFFGQDAQSFGNRPSYRDNGDGTVTDLVTGLMWQKSADRNGDGVINYADKLFFDEALANASSFNLAGYDDWRLPTIKELYSLIQFSGAEISPTATSTAGSLPFIDAAYFDVGYGDLSANERLIDGQVATSTIYVSTTMGGDRTMFGVNFIDGRIKGYPAGTQKKYYVLYVRGNSSYGVNNFANNGDGTVTDLATGLMWSKADSGTGLNWSNALAWVQAKNAAGYLGYNDWRLPNAKELQSIVDYYRAPATSLSAAINPVFDCTAIVNEAGATDYPCYWTSTTFSSLTPSNGTAAVYLSFGRAMGYMAQHGGWVDVHGTGAQRSDPKAGNPADYPYGHGPQGDAIRIFNYVRLVRGGLAATSQAADNATDLAYASGWTKRAAV